MSQELATRTASVPAELQEKVLLGGDLAKLSPTERLSYYNAVCTSVGLNPLTRPFEYLILNERMVLYARKDCTDQLRDLHGISVEIASRDVIDGVCVVTARAKNMTDRIDESVGAVPFMKENGEWKRSDTSGKSFFKPDGTYSPLSLADRSNAMMKAETKAKRRVTLSICGLGMFDETEIDTMPEAKKLQHAEEEERPPLLKPSEILALEEAKEKHDDYQDTFVEPAQRLADALNQDAPASLFAAYREQIALSQSVAECSNTLNTALKDETLTVFEVTQLKDEGKQKIVELRKN